MCDIHADDNNNSYYTIGMNSLKIILSIYSLSVNLKACINEVWKNFFWNASLSQSYASKGQLMHLAAG